MAYKRPSTTANEVADYLLWLSQRDGYPIDNLKLQKLLYYVQAWALVEEGEPVFADKIEAWPEGPAFYDVWKRFERAGQSKITLENHQAPAVLDHVATAVERAWARYGSLSGLELADMTHHEEPWAKTREGLGRKDRSKREIPLEDVRSYYAGRLESENARLRDLLDAAHRLAERPSVEEDERLGG